MAAQGRHRLQDEHEYRGMLLPGHIRKENLEGIQSFEFKEDVAVVSYPKTGTTWVCDLTWILFNDGDVDRARQESINSRILYLEVTDNKGISGLEKANKLPRPNIFRSHVPAEFFANSLAQNKIKVIVPLRNPKDTLVSLYHFFKSNEELGNFKGTWDEFFKTFVEGPLCFNGHIFDWYRSWWRQRNLPNVLLVRFEDMKKDLPKELKRISSFIGKDISDDVIDRVASYGNFNNMKKNTMVNFANSSVIRNDISPFMRKGEVGDWKNHFSKQQNEFVDKKCSELAAEGLTFEYELPS